MVAVQHLNRNFAHLVPDLLIACANENPFLALKKKNYHQDLLKTH